MAFSVRVMYEDGSIASGVGVAIDYSSGGWDEHHTDSEGWVEFSNSSNDFGTIFVHGDSMGEHSLADGKTYSFTI